MRIERVRPTTVRVTLHPLELATLVSAARWVVQGAEGQLSPGALAQLRQVVQGYDAAVRASAESTADRAAGR